MTNQSTAVSVPANVDHVFDAIEAFIKQRPGIDPRNYGSGRDGMSAYRSELRSIASDRKRAMKALEEARGLDPQKPELLMGAFRAFSGRLQWVCEEAPSVDYTCPCGMYVHSSRRSDHQIHIDDCPYKGHLDYTTGQYFPTEYRKAAASVLETYIADWRQAYAAEHPQTFVYHTIEDVKAANAQIGHHYFDRDTMRFFNCRIESGLIGGKYFITSERREPTDPKRYSVRVANPDGTIDTVGEFQAYLTREDARDAIRELMKGGK